MFYREMFSTNVPHFKEIQQIISQHKRLKKPTLAMSERMKTNGLLILC
jgi:hypothetical protein